MKNVFLSTSEFDKNASSHFHLPSELLMENAASGMYHFIKSRFSSNSAQDSKKILLVCGSGDNGADCLALARMLCGICEVYVFLAKAPKSPLCVAQLKRLESLKEKANLRFLKSLKTTNEFDIIIDGIFGAGFKGQLDLESARILNALNKCEAVKIACDIPSGITQNGALGGNVAFKADFTLTMGALKYALFGDLAKDFVGEVHLISLGISEAIFAPDSTIKLLEKSDFKPPHRIAQNTNKGDFGHLCVCAGEKVGAGVLSALAGLRSGAGLVSVISKNGIPNLPFELMSAQEIPQNTSAILLGMGLGRDFTLKDIKKLKNKALLLDADIFYNSAFLELINFKNIVLTPHPKEFTQILKALKLATISTQELQENRISYALKFCKAYPNAILVLKGANTMICKGSSVSSIKDSSSKDSNDGANAINYESAEVYINPFGNNALAKGGSGDVLAGIIGGLLAQGYTPLDSAINGVLLHSFCAQKIAKKCNDFSLSPLDLIEQIRYI